MSNEGTIARTTLRKRGICRDRFFCIAGWFLLLALPGCKSLGPRSLPRDRFNYNQAGAESASQQLLLNIVRLRYGEPTYWLEISSMLSQYELKAGGALKWFDYTLMPFRNPGLRAVYGLDPDPALDDSREANLEFTDRPTISYSPLQGREFADRLMAPIPPPTIMYLADSGWPVDRVLDCCVQRVNGIPNSPIHDVGPAENFDPAPFQRVSQLLRSMQDRGELRFSLEYDAAGKTAYLHTLQPQESAEIAEELRGILKYESPEGKLRLSNAPLAAAEDELALQTRSLLATMFALSESFEPPPDHVKSGQVLQGLPAEQNAAAKWLSIRSSRLPVTDAFVQVRHNGYWFYIDQSDFKSKRTFALLTYLFSLQALDKTGAGPLLTVPTS